MKKRLVILAVTAISSLGLTASAFGAGVIMNKFPANGGTGSSGTTPTVHCTKCM